jgi:hypothetical protein
LEVLVALNKGGGIIGGGIGGGGGGIGRRINVVIISVWGILIEWTIRSR